MTRYRGLTWDHPRGANALRAAEHSRGIESFGIDWDVQPLEGFESHPIADLAEQYDLIVLDHPHLGEACAEGVLRPLDDLFSAEQLAGWARDTVGPSFTSYTYEGRQWAVPLDAATQVAAIRTDLLAQVPSTWVEVAAAAAAGGVALSLSGPHAFLTFASVCAALGEAPQVEGQTLVSRDTGEQVLALMGSIAAQAVPDSDVQSPIALLERMATTDDIAYCPLVYGYVNYSSAVLRFVDAPRGARRGSTIGGTGLALSQRCVVTPELLTHIEWLMARDTQIHFVPTHDGQPSHRAAWSDNEVDRRSWGFYSSTRATMDAAWVRPRYPGFIRFQTQAAAIIRAAVTGEASSGAALERLDAGFRATQRTPATEQGATL